MNQSSRRWSAVFCSQMGGWVVGLGGCFVAEWEGQAKPFVGYAAAGAAVAQN
jgi:hypothetical protein